LHNRGWLCEAAWMNAYSLDLRLKVLDAVDRGIPRKEVVRTFGVSMPTLERYLRRRREGAGLDPGRSPGRTPSICATVEERRALWKQLQENADATLERHCELWEKERKVRVSISTMSRAIRHKLGWTLKKRLWEPPSETKRREVLGESA
jgi:transposase